MKDGERGFIKTRGASNIGPDKRIHMRQIRVRIVGYLMDGEMYDSVDEAYAARPFDIVDGQIIYRGNGPREVVEDVK